MGLVSARPIPEPEALPAPDLAHADASVRRRVAQMLGETVGNEKVLCAHLMTERDTSVREAALLALVRMNTPEAAEGLAQLLGHEEAALRNGALESLSAMPKEAAQVLDRLAQSSDPDVRIFAALLAGDLPHDWIEAWLIDALEAEEDANVCAAIAEVLAEAGGEQAEPALRELSGRFPDEPFLAFVATTALRRLGAK